MYRTVCSRSAETMLAAAHRPPRLALLALAALLALTGGCASAHPRTDRRPRLDRTVITEQQIRDGYYGSAYEVVEALRANWLRPRGPDSFVRPTPVWVYVNGSRLGGVETLRTIVPGTIAHIRYYDGITASGHWGVGHGMGVIYVSTMPSGAKSMVPFDAPDLAALSAGRGENGAFTRVIPGPSSRGALPRWTARSRTEQPVAGDGDGDAGDVDHLDG